MLQLVAMQLKDESNLLLYLDTIPTVEMDMK